MSDLGCDLHEPHAPHAWRGQTLEWCPGYRVVHDRGENAPPPPDWSPDPHPWCPSCMVPKCGCPEGDRLTDEAYRAIEEAHIVRGSE